MQVVAFTWRAKYGHFLRAEANASALTYPVPPRTTVIGLLGAILGLGKDAPQTVLHSAQVAISGAPPQRFWHRIKLRKKPPALLPYTVKKGGKAKPAAEDEEEEESAKGSGSDEKATLIRQEWLWRPSFDVYVALPDQPALFDDLAWRLRERRWHFSPCMGLSELLADVECRDLVTARRLPEGDYAVASYGPQPFITLRGGDGIGVHLLRMPYSVDGTRVFQHQGIFIERQGQPIPVRTAHAWQVGEKVLIFF